MCSIEANDRIYPTGNYDASSGGVRPLQTNQTEYLLVSLGLTLKLVDSWIQ